MGIISLHYLKPLLQKTLTYLWSLFKVRSANIKQLWIETDLKNAILYSMSGCGVSCVQRSNVNYLKSMVSP